MVGICLALIDDEDDKDKFEKLYYKYRKLMFSVAMDIVCDNHLAEDAIQEAFLRVAKNIHKVDDTNHPKTKRFLVIITQNTSKDILSDRKGVISENDFGECENEASYNIYITDQAFDNVSVKALAKYIQELPAIYSHTLFLHNYYGYTIQETASLMNCSADTVKKRSQRGKQMLRSALENGGYYGK